MPWLHPKRWHSRLRIAMATPSAAAPPAPRGRRPRHDAGDDLCRLAVRRCHAGHGARPCAAVAVCKLLVATRLCCTPHSHSSPPHGAAWCWYARNGRASSVLHRAAYLWSVGVPCSGAARCTSIQRDVHVLPAARRYAEMSLRHRSGMRQDALARLLPDSAARVSATDVVRVTLMSLRWRLRARAAGERVPRTARS